MCGPVAGTEPPDGDAALKKSQGLHKMEKQSLVRLIHRQGLSEARWDSYQNRCVCWERVLSV